jgi:hypothetical protein
MRILALAAVAFILWLFFVGRKSQGGTSAAAMAGNSFMGGGVGGAVAFDPDSAANNSLSNLLDAIFHIEGGKPGNRNVRNNNPMDIEYGKFAKRHGAIGSDGRFAIFPDMQTGWDAMNALVSAKVGQHPDWNFYDLFSYFLRGSTTAPPVDKEGDSNSYAQYVASYVGVDPTQTVASVIGGS